MTDAETAGDGRRRRSRRTLTAEARAAITAIVTRVLAGDPDEQVYRLFVERVAALFAAQDVTLQLIDADTRLGPVVAGVGPANDLASERPELPPEVARRLIDVGVHVLPEPVLDWARPLVGPTMLARFGPGSGGGLLAVGRPPGAALFTGEDAELLFTLSQQVALALELGRARADQARLAVLEGRERIARELHDTVLQDLIAVGIQLNLGLAAEPDPARQNRDAALVEQLEEAVHRLRGSVSGPRPVPTGPALDDAVREVAAAARHVLGHRPVVGVTGYVDVVPPAVHHAVLVVLREALSNVALHAEAEHTWVRLDLDDDGVRLVVEDDGRGLPEPLVPREGLAAVHRHAHDLHGDATVTGRPGGGARLVWTAGFPDDDPARGGR